MKRTFKKGVHFFLSVFSMVALTSCDMESFGDDLASNIGSKLIPNIWAFLVQFIALIILLCIVFFFGYKPCKRLIEKRKELLTNEVKETKENNLKSQANYAESQKRLADTRKEASKIIEEATKEANKTSQEILDLTHEEIIRIRDKANKDIERAKEEATKSLKNEIVDVALDASTKILSRVVTKEDNSKIVEDFINDLNKGK